jgi:hypothetical protein
MVIRTSSVQIELPAGPASTFQSARVVDLPADKGRSLRNLLTGIWDFLVRICDFSLWELRLVHSRKWKLMSGLHRPS